MIALIELAVLVLLIILIFVGLRAVFPESLGDQTNSRKINSKGEGQPRRWLLLESDRNRTEKEGGEEK